MSPARDGNGLWVQPSGRLIQLNPVGQDYLPKGKSHYMELSVGTLCKLISLIDRQEFEYTWDAIRQITRIGYQRHLIARWEVIESGRV
jgi:hypothetical protein